MVSYKFPGFSNIKIGKNQKDTNYYTQLLFNFKHPVHIYVTKLKTLKF
jgi:hypothetical protein